MKYLSSILFLSLSIARADTLAVSLDTSSLAGSQFSFVLYLIDGDGLANNTATAGNAKFGGGSLVGAPTLVGGASGSLASTATLTDSDVFNAIGQDFTAGSSLSFDLAFTTNFAGGTPDSLAFLLFDNTGSTVPTLDPLGGDVLLIFDLSHPELGHSYATDPNRTTLSLTAPAVTPADVTAPVPEPSSFLLGATVLGGIALRTRSRTRGRRVD